MKSFLARYQWFREYLGGTWFPVRRNGRKVYVRREDSTKDERDQGRAAFDVFGEEFYGSRRFGPPREDRPRRR